MLNYKIYTNDYGVVNIIKSDDYGVYAIPATEDNVDYQEYLKWVAEGNTAEEIE